MIRPPPRSTRVRSSAASDVYKRQGHEHLYRGKVKYLAGIKAFGFFRQSMATATAIGDIVKNNFIGAAAHFQLFARAALLSTRLALGLPAKAFGFSKRILGRWDAA